MIQNIKTQKVPKAKISVMLTDLFQVINVFQTFLDTAKTSKGFLSLKAYRLTPMTIQLYKSGDFTADNIKDLKVTHDSLFEEVPIVIKNSHLVNELLLELSEQLPVESGCQFLDLGTADVLEEQLKYLIVSVDELNQVKIFSNFTFN